MAMTKHISNEQYEKDKDLAIAFCESTVVERTPAEIKQMKRIADLLKQSKWIGAYPTENDINAMKLSAYADGYEDCERYKEYVEDNG